MSGQRFQPYHGILADARRLAKQHRVVGDLDEMLLSTLSMGLGVSDNLTAVLERAHYGLAHRVFYITKELASALHESSMTEATFDDLMIPYRLFEVCVEHGFKIAGTDLQFPSILVCVCPDETIVSSMVRTVKDAAKLGKRSIEISIGGMERMFRTVFRSPYDDSLCHCTVDMTKCRGKSIEQVVDELHVTEGNMPLSVAEATLQKSAMRIISAALCYLNVKDCDRSAYKDHQRLRLYRQPTIELLGGDSSRSPQWHLRKGHFRVLRHERYRKEEDGSPRVVWVRQAQVNPEADPAYPEKKPDAIDDAPRVGI